MADTCVGRCNNLEIMFCFSGLPMSDREMSSFWYVCTSEVNARAKADAFRIFEPPSSSSSSSLPIMSQQQQQHRDLTALPKAELHIHLEGSMRRTTLISLCNKYNIDIPKDTRGKKFDDFSAFASVYIAACECLRETSDLNRLLLEVAEDAAASGARWIEPALSMLSFCAHRFGGKEETLRLLMRAAERAEVWGWDLLWRWSVCFRWKRRKNWRIWYTVV
mmetsp:Transcript_31876/g.54360  ORF Transcript_31876/g.54360 Transcript_31876/m.54360 type:complete len:220 (-) Transcript_31876:230-889(-)